MEKAKLNKIIDMAAGREKTDLLIINCKFVDVYNLELVDGPLAIGEGKIVGWGKEYEAKEVLDAKGGIVLPGLIDGHVHIESSSLIPTQFARCILPFGTTSIIADPHEIANVCGLEGIRYMVRASRNIPLHVYVQLPSCVPATPFEESGAVLMAKDLEQLIEEEGILGLGEVMDFPGVMNHSDNMIDKLLMAAKHNRVIDGHSPGLSGKGLAAYVAGGILTDHECSDTEAMLERLRMGQYILLREGSTCKDLLNLIPGITPANARHCVLCTDDREPDDILTSGHINKSLRLAVEAGLDPLLAVSIATLNAAECFRLYDKGAIAPGKDADLLIVHDLKEFTPKHVFSLGKEVARDGKLLVEIEDYTSESVLNTVNFAPIDESSFRLPLCADKALAIGVIPKSVVTEKLVLPVQRNAEGCFDAQQNPGLNKLAVIERHNATGHIGLGIIAGYGIKNGAIAVSVAHDSHNIVVAGDNDKDMLAAVNHVKKIGGGFAIAQNGNILNFLALPVAGLMTDRPAAEVAEIMASMITTARTELSLPDTFHPLMTLVFMSLPVIPDLKLTSTGLFDVTAFKPVNICDIS